MVVRGPVVAQSEIGVVSEGPFHRLPDVKDLFERRAARLRRLAPDSPIGDFLGFVADLAQAQHGALALLPPFPSPDAGAIDRALEHGMPIFGRSDWPRDRHWQSGLDAVLAHMARTDLPAAASQAIDALAGMPASGREELADGLLAGRADAMPLGQTPFLAAALEVYWARLAQSLAGVEIRALDPAWLCPVCGSPPLVSLIDAPGLAPRLRYLHCSLCATDWRYLRAACACCGSQKQVAYHAIEGVGGPARAETCDDCKGYVKILSCENDNLVDPMADDLASAGLDLMIDEAGWHRNIPNPFLLAG